MSEVFRAQICERHPGTCPLIFGCVDLCGPDPNGDEGSEVLWGRGAVVVLDPPPESVRVGSYELLFYDENYAAPMVRLLIGPRLKLEPQREVGYLDGRASTAPRRFSSDGRRTTLAGGIPTSFNMVVPGSPLYGLTFDSELDATSFMRDLSVRQRLVALSLKTSRGWRTVEELQDELSEMRRQGLIATTWRLVYQGVLLLVISWLVYVCALYSQTYEQPLVDVAITALGDASSAASALLAWVADIGTATCGFIANATPTVDVHRCALLPEASEVADCTRALVGVSPWSADF